MPALPDFLIGKRVLVMLGNHAAREAVSLLLARMGLVPIEAQSQEQGVRIIAGDQAGFGLVLWEGGCGVRLAADALVRSGKPLPPIICLVRAGVELSAEDKGCGPVLRRPVSRVSLCDAMLDAFGLSRAGTGGEGLDSGCASGPGSFGCYDPVIFNGTSLLLVEDNPINRQVASEILELAGARVTHASNGLEAVRLVDASIDAEPFDAVLMDIQMPVMDGFEAASRIRREHPTLRLPIIALTAHAMRGQRERCLASGMSDFVSKPIEVEGLLATLARWIRPRSGIDNQVSPPAPLALAPAEMPEKVPGLDVRQGIRRLLGHSDRYMDLLRAFARDFAGAAEDLRAALNAGDIEGAGRLAHTVKGVAGNISADGLRQAAQEIEAAVKSDVVTDLGGLAEAFEDRLREVLTSIGTIGHEPQGPELEVRSLLRPMRVLLVEDSRLYRMVVGSMLHDLGHSVSMAENGLKAMEILSAEGAQPFDLIILDLVMPVMDGFATATAIRRLERTRGGRSTTIIGFSALDDANGAIERERAINVGMDDCIPKTVGEVELQAALARVINARSALVACEDHREPDVAKASLLLAELEECLRGNDFQAEDVFKQLVEALGGVNSHPELALLGENIRRFEFRRALDGLPVLAAWAGVDECAN